MNLRDMVPYLFGSVPNLGGQSIGFNPAMLTSGILPGILYESGANPMIAGLTQGTTPGILTNYNDGNTMTPDYASNLRKMALLNVLNMGNTNGTSSFGGGAINNYL